MKQRRHFLLRPLFSRPLLSRPLLSRPWSVLPVFLAALLLAGSAALAREASFVQPGSGGGGTVQQGIVADPLEMDLGETLLGIAKRATVFFANTSLSPVELQKFEVTSDGNVAAEIGENDCEKLKTLVPQQRCSVNVQITPISGGSWSAQLLIQHNGDGRVSRAVILGQTLGGGKADADKEKTGLSLSEKKVEPIDFGSIEAGRDRAVRTALVVNDSAEILTLHEIEVIAPDNGLARLEQGCAAEAELKPGESCPITLVWEPKVRGTISTDLIVRHTGRLGFMVVPIRGNATGDTPGEVPRQSLAGQLAGGAGNNNADGSANAGGRADTEDTINPPPPLPMPAGSRKNTINASSLFSDEEDDEGAASDLELIGTAGNRAILKGDNETHILAVGETTRIGRTKVTLVSLDGREATIRRGKHEEETLRLSGSQNLRLGQSEDQKNDASGSKTSSTNTGPSKSTSRTSSSSSLSSAASATGSAASAAFPPSAGGQPVVIGGAP